MTATKKHVRGTMVGEFRGEFPTDIEPSPGVDMEALLEGDPDPMFLTLPVAQSQQVSANGLRYTDTLVNSILLQINSDKTEGIAGHLTDEERSTAFPMPDIYWIGAAKVGDTVWAKGYIPRSKPDVREHYRILKMVGGRAATSIYGLAIVDDKDDGTWEALDFELEQLDLAPYKRAALQLGGAFQLSAEMDNTSGDETMEKAEVIRQLTIEDAPSLPEAVREHILAPSQTVIANLRSALGLAEDADLLAAVTELHTKAVAAHQAEIDAYVMELVSNAETGVKLETMRPIVADLVKAEKPATKEAAAELYAAVMQREHVKKQLAGQVEEMAGPPQTRPASQPKQHSFIELPES